MSESVSGGHVIIDGERYTGRCEAGHTHTFEAPRFAPWIPVDCPTCRDAGHMSGSLAARLVYGKPEPFEMKVEAADV